ncbi:cohesin domain-containing protein, partial [Chloroflexota bacterium]
MVYKIRRVVYTIITLFVLVALTLVHPITVLAADTLVTVSAPSSVNPGETFNVTIRVNPGTPIAGVQCSLNFDGSLVTAESVREGSLLGQGGATFFNPGVIGGNSVNGIVGAIITPGGTASGSGTFATITFNAGTEGGTSPIALSGVIIGDINGDSIPISMINDEITVI